MTKVSASAVVDTSGTKQFCCQISREAAELPWQINMCLFTIILSVHYYPLMSKTKVSRPCRLEQKKILNFEGHLLLEESEKGVWATKAQKSQRLAHSCPDFCWTCCNKETWGPKICDYPGASSLFPIGFRTATRNGDNWKQAGLIVPIVVPAFSRTIRVYRNCCVLVW